MKEDVGDVIKMSDEVVSLLVEMKACEVKGVAALTSTIGDGLVTMFGGKNKAEGVKLRHGDDGLLTVDLYIAVNYGYRIPDVALRLQEHIKTEVERETGQQVSAVNIFVQQIIFPTPGGAEDGVQDGGHGDS